MIGLPENESKERVYRIDRMKHAQLTALSADKCPVNFNLDKYSSRIFDMFTGTTAEVHLECSKYIVNYLMDRFGSDFKVISEYNDKFIAKVLVDVSPTFYSWIFQFKGDIRILSPTWVCDEFDKVLRKCISNIG